MDKFELAKLLYDKGYEHRQVRSIWAYVYIEQTTPRSGKKPKSWQLKALEEVSVAIEDIKFSHGDTGELNNYL